MDHTCPDGECWRQIPRAPRYSVSCIGRVRRDDTGRILSPGLHPAGYHLVKIGDKGASRSHHMHRLVYETFVGPVPAGMFVRHYNDVPGDNRLANLEIGTPKQNSEDRRRNGNHGTKLSEAGARQILALRAQGLTYTVIGARVGVTRGQACHICLGHSWAHLQPAATATP